MFVFFIRVVALSVFPVLYFSFRFSVFSFFIFHFSLCFILFSFFISFSLHIFIFVIFHVSFHFSEENDKGAPARSASSAEQKMVGKRKTVRLQMRRLVFPKRGMCRKTTFVVLATSRNALEQMLSNITEDSNEISLEMGHPKTNWSSTHTPRVLLLKAGDAKVVEEARHTKHSSRNSPSLRSSSILQRQSISVLLPQHCLVGIPQFGVMAPVRLETRGTLSSRPTVLRFVALVPFLRLALTTDIHFMSQEWWPFLAVRSRSA